MSLLGEMLVKNGIITPEQLETALKLQKEKGMRLGEILLELGYITSKDLFWMLSEQADIPFIELKPEMLDNELINKFPERLLVDNCILPLYQTNDRIYVVVGDPTNVSVIEELKKLTKKEVTVSGADPDKIGQLLNKLFLYQDTETAISTRIRGGQKVDIKIDNAVIEIEDERGRRKKRGRLRIIIELKGEDEN